MSQASQNGCHILFMIVFRPVYIVIIGAGEVGSYLAQILVEEGHSIAIIESNPKLAKSLESRLDALVIQGSGLNRSCLVQAGIKRADMVMALTQVDEVNLVACMTANQHGNSPMTVARVRNTNYLDSTMLSAETLGFSYLVSPEHSLANEVMSILSYDGAGEIHYLCERQVALLEFPLGEQSPLRGLPLKDIRKHLPHHSLVAAISDENGLRIPDGQDTLEQGHRVFALATPDEIKDFSALSGQPWHHVKHVLMIGCGDIGFHLAQELECQGFVVTIIELDGERAEWVSGELRRTTVLHGDGTDPDLLREQLELRADAVVVLLDDDEKAILVGLFCKHLGAQKVIVRNDKPAYAPIGHKMGLDALLSPKIAVADQVLRFVRRGHVQSSHMLGDHEAEIMEVQLTDMERDVFGKPLQEMTFPKGILIGAILRQDEVMIPRGTTTLLPNDTLLVVTEPKHAKAVTDFFV